MRFESSLSALPRSRAAAMIARAILGRIGGERRASGAASAARRLRRSMPVAPGANRREAAVGEEQRHLRVGVEQRAAGPFSSHSFIQTAATAQSVLAATSHSTGARAPVAPSCAKTSGTTTALKPGSSAKASRQCAKVEEVSSTSAVRSEGFATEPKSGTTASRVSRVFSTRPGGC